ncbi:uncharacterized protein BKCO1_610005 [Diplodia corticola]|uniref:Uncharacterized protein n=1 Tax=Diplodia corticola TaxID=236234 RepID=A0A1J9QPM3_9PEZI|nr:uncharacterized protein BKCO1_610005 [Diplodia corticola]OJD30408.1 hypothetical protein BKCO1_610005 [Diplodia corticola]
MSSPQKVSATSPAQKISATSASSYEPPLPQEARARTSPMPVELAEKCQALVSHSIKLDMGETFDEQLHAWFPDTQGKDDFYRWMYGRHERTKKQCETPASPQEFVAHVDGMNFHNMQDADLLIDWQIRDVRPWLPLGRTSDGTGYRLLPKAYGLLPHDQLFNAESTPYELLPPCFLGVNLTVQPREPSRPANRREANLSEESTRTAESDDNPPGFEFQQLGELQYYVAALPDTIEDAAEGLWEPTGYYVVARIAPTGCIDGLYVLFDMFPVEDEYTGIRSQITGDEWGYMEPSDEQFTCARIGNRLGEMRFGKELLWTERVRHPVELVRVVRMGDGRLKRVSVDEVAR